MARAVSPWPLTAEAWARYEVSPFVFCCGQRGTVTGFYPITLVFPCKYTSTMHKHHTHSPATEAV